MFLHLIKAHLLLFLYTYEKLSLCFLRHVTGFVQMDENMLMSCLVLVFPTSEDRGR